MSTKNPSNLTGKRGDFFLNDSIISFQNKNTAPDKLNLKGVKKAVWDMNLLLLHVNYNSKKVNLTEIKQAIADAGYDTETIKASDEKYNNLHYCCKYDRNQ